MCGYDWEIEGDYEEVDIDNGVPGYNRIDLLVARVETAPAEKVELKVYKGEETTGEPVVPGNVEGDLNDGDTVCEMPICSVRVNGINPQAPKMLVEESIDASWPCWKSSGITSPRASMATNSWTSRLPPRSSPIWPCPPQRSRPRRSPRRSSPTRAVSDKLGLTYEGAVSDFGTLYVLGGKIGIMQVYCLKTAALAAWGSITAKLPGGYKSARSMAASLTCEDHHERPRPSALWRATP